MAWTRNMSRERVRSDSTFYLATEIGKMTWPLLTWGRAVIGKSFLTDRLSVAVYWILKQEVNM